MKVCSFCGQIDFTGSLFWCPLCDYAMVSLEPISDLTVVYSPVIESARALPIHPDFLRKEVI